ncbi:hypothetical protein AXG93_3017s1130 [Marchantia polymorpha subsp. ruderalis]|uniref:DUF4201 domain-containing protein n=1 Tax=Marchantia polymorpha subsp. ruderalis TaxID=1480154 RepID=A0A176WI83_MARPO|nr:hypothetical protein AXG93_3017s1130 [Marchantia polymorpha subsp. ruderalis]
MAPKKDAAKTEDPPLSPPAKDTKAPASKKDDAKDAKAPGGKKVSVKPAADAKKGSKTGEALLGPPEPPPEDPVVTQLKADSEVQKAEIIRLREVLSIIGSGEGDVREAKIIDLFKKNRFLNLSLEKERVRASKMANQIKVLQEELLNKVKAEMSPESDIPDFGQKKEVVETWEEKYKKVLAKMQKIQAKKDMLAADIPKLQNIIRREVGEHIPLNKILEEGTTWRGRSEQIALLKGQLAESQKRLNELEPIASGESRPATYNEQRKMVDLQLMHRNQLEAANYERRKELGNLATSYNLLRDHWEMTKNKLDKTIARKNILEIEIRDAKAKVAVLVSKSENDDLLINALTLELAAARQALGPPFPRPGGPLQLEHHYRCNKMAATLSDLQYQCTQQASPYPSSAGTIL